MKRKLLIGVGALLIIAMGAGYYLYHSLDRLIKVAIETYGSEITQVAVRVDRVKIDPAEGIGGIYGLSIANPKGFTSSHALKLGEASLDIALKTVMDPVVTINQVKISRPQFFYDYEFKSRKSNLDQIQQNISSYTDRGAQSEPKRTSANNHSDASQNSSSSAPKLIVKHLIIEEPEVSVSAKLPFGKEVSKSLKLKTIHLKDLGAGEGGITGKELAQKIVSVIQSQIGGVEGLGLTDQLGGLKNKAKEKLNDAKNEIKEKLEEKAKGLLDKKNLKKFF